MAIPIIIPRLGWNMEEGIFLGWLIKDGDPVHAGESLFRLEGEKATEDIECHDNGTLRLIPGGPKDGDRLPVGTVIGYLLQAGESEIPATASVVSAGRAAVPNTKAEDVGAVTVRKRGSVVASPRARRVAAELRVDWAALHGSGKSGRVRECDVRAAAAQGAGNIVPLSPLRRAGVDRLVKSANTTVPVTLTTTADATGLVTKREKFKNDALVPSFSDFVVKWVALALQQHPLLGSRWAEDRLVLADEINIGIAVHTDAGLLVPVVRQVPELSLQQLAARSRDLIERARAGTLTSKELQGGVFTITNLGMYGIDAFTPVINYPECAILGIGRIRRVPVFEDDRVVARDQVTLSLTFDHRVVDGVPAALFLQTLVKRIENPSAE